jgi:hypothetical protein
VELPVLRVLQELVPLEQLVLLALTVQAVLLARKVPLAPLALAQPEPRV